MHALRANQSLAELALRIFQCDPVPLNTVRDLLGHADIGMTLRYAHPADSHKMEAVMKLDNLEF